jgi:hypothetical protein
MKKVDPTLKVRQRDFGPHYIETAICQDRLGTLNCNGVLRKGVFSGFRYLRRFGMTTISLQRT